jgi:hypothetical protein
MKKIILFSIGVFFLITKALAQDIKIKKGELLIDGTPIAKISSKDKVVSYSDLSGNFLFTAEAPYATVSGNSTPERWLRFKGANNNVREISLPYSFKLTFSIEKYVTDAILKTIPELLPLKGANNQFINQFFASQDQPFSDRWDAIYEEEREATRTEQELANADKLRIEQNDILKDGNKIGTISAKVSKMDNFMNKPVAYKYTVTDENGGQVASLEYEAKADGFYIIKTYDQKEFSILSKLIEPQPDKAPGYDPLAKRIVQRLYANGYPFGDMTVAFEQFLESKKQEAKRKYNEKREEAKVGSMNLYNVAGYVIDKNNEKKEGALTIEFESIEKRMGATLPDRSTLGRLLKLKDQAGNVITFNADDKVKFCAEGHCYLGVEPLENDYMKSSSFADPYTYQFFEILYEKDGNYVLNHIAYPDDYLLKVKGNDKAIYLGEKGIFRTKKPEKIQRLLTKYLNCPSMDPTKYNTFTKEGLIEVIQDYQKNCQ